MLNIRLLRAPDYSPEEYFTVCQLLQSFTMPGWEFIPIETEIDPEDGPYQQPGRQHPEDVHFDYHSPVEKIMYNKHQPTPLSWQELFEVCEFYRDIQRVPEADFVVLLTKRPNALNWFSAFDHRRNIFVHTGGWEQFTESLPQYPVAYEVIANVLQTQMQLNKEGKDACLHEIAKGCMNDFCIDKKEINFKLRTADICITCGERLQMCEVPDHLVEAALQGFESLRKQMLFNQGFRRYNGTGQLVIKNHRLTFPTLGNLTVKSTPLARTLYIFFLRHPEGVRRVDLPDHRKELLDLYGRVSGLGNREQQGERIDRLIDPLEGSFDENRSRINRAFTTALGETLAKPYLISGMAGGAYKIEVPRDQVTIIV